MDGIQNDGAAAVHVTEKEANCCILPREFVIDEQARRCESSCD